ncbi:hypothetical protein JST99_02625 [Candidatus Dependentiae bacterium]|nr:hypothetical protein [Candidatus Dependentiae bacterium]
MNIRSKNSAVLLSLCLMSSALVASDAATTRQLPFQTTSSASSTLSAPLASTSTSSSSWSWFTWPSLPSFSWSAPSRETTYNIALASLLAATAYGGWRGWRYYQERQRQADVGRKEASWAKIEESDIDEALAAQKEKQAGVYKRRALWANEEWQKTEKSEQTKPLNPKGKSVTWCQEPTKIITDE